MNPVNPNLPQQNQPYTGYNKGMPGNTYPTSGTTGYTYPSKLGLNTDTSNQPMNVPMGTNTVHTGNLAYTKGEHLKWDNPHGLSIPVITFDPTCKKCHGSGVSKSRFTGTPLPCTRCYTRHGYCKKCYGTGTHYRKNKPCSKCEAGKRLKNKSSSSSDSPWLMC